MLWQRSIKSQCIRKDFDAIRKNSSSKDPVLIAGTIENIEGNVCMPVEITNDLMEICIQQKKLREDILFACDDFEKDDRTIKLILQWKKPVTIKIKKRLELFLADIAPEIILENEELLKEYISPKLFEFARKIISFKGKKGEELAALWQDYNKLLVKFNRSKKKSMFKEIAQIQDVLIQANEYDEEKVKEIMAKDFKNPSFSAEGIFAIRAIGILNLDEWMPRLIPLLERYEEEVLVSIVSETLIKNNSNTIVQALEAVILNEITFFEVVYILEQIHTEEAEKVLLETLLKVSESDEKQLLLYTLINRLSEAVMPLIDQFYLDFEPASMFELEEILYFYYKSLGKTHPDLDEWRMLLEEKKDFSEDEFSRI